MSKTIGVLARAVSASVCTLEDHFLGEISETTMLNGCAYTRLVFLQPRVWHLLSTLSTTSLVFSIFRQLYLQPSKCMAMSRRHERA